MPQFAAVIFDMDGVIVNSEPIHEMAFREIFAEIGYGANHGIDFPAYYGRSDLALWKDFIARHRPAETLAELTERKQRRFLEIVRKEEPIFDGLTGLVEKLSEHYRLAVASGSLHPVIEVILGMKNLARYFQTVVSVEDVPRGKPEPDIFLRAAELLAVAPAACCVIEDSSAGVAAARAAGMTVVAITNSLPRERLAQADVVADSYLAIERLLLPP